MNAATLRIGLGGRILGLVFVFAAAVTLFYLLSWLPNVMQTERETLRNNIDRHVKMTAKVLGTELIQADFAAIESLLDNLRRTNSNWASVELKKEPDGKALYLSSNEDDSTTGSEQLTRSDILWFTETISEQEVPLASLVIAVDIGPEIRRVRRQLHLFGLALLAGVLGLGGSMAYLLNRSVRQPVKALSEASQSLAGGDFEAELPPITGDEVGALVDGFDRMRRNLARQRKELEVACDNAEQANRAKSKFLATASHELRTPLGVILGFADVLENQASDPSETSRISGIIARNGRYLLELVNQILDLAKLESGEFLSERQTTDIEMLLEDIVAEAQSQIAGKPVHCRFELDGNVPRQIIIDPVRLKQILLNLVANANRFTDEGHILLRARWENAGEARVLSIDVEDTGCGIDPSIMSTLFEPFQQGPERRAGGAGLGLTISKEIAQFLGGDLCVANNTGGGATFTLTMPFEKSAVDSSQSFARGEQDLRELADSIRGIRVLLAEDYDDAADLMMLELKRIGLQPQRAANGLEAVELAKEESFDLCLMDMQMPLLNGYEATRQLRNFGFTAPIIALTAHAMRGDREACLDAGCDDYESKPVDIRRLAEKMVRATRKRGGDLAPQANTTTEISELDYDRELEKMACRFFEQLPEQLQAIELSFASGDTADAQFVAHKLAGSAASLLAPNLASVARQFEEAIRGNAEMQQVHDSYESLCSAIRDAIRDNEKRARP